jgi:transposase InsO family protein
VKSRPWWFAWRKRTGIGATGASRVRCPGHEIARSTIADILERHGLEPAPERSRKTTWKEFLTRHWELIVAADFFTVEVATRRGLQRFLVLFFIELSTRKVEIAGVAANANGLWMSQIGRNLTDAVDGILSGKRYLIHDRDPLFTTEFLSMLEDAGVKSVKLAPRSPNLNAYAERFVRTIKESCLERMILFGEASLRAALHDFVPLSHRAQPPGVGQPDHRPGTSPFWKDRSGQTASATGRHAQLLLPSGLTPARLFRRILRRRGSPYAEVP